MELRDSDILKAKNINVLSCVIVIGDYDKSKTNLINLETAHHINTCINIEIEDSYQTLVNKARVTLPRDLFSSYDRKDSSGKNTISRLLSSDNISSLFSKGSRIMIWLGYDGDLKTKYNMTMLFNGFIVSADPKTPFVLHCEDFGWLLKKKIVYPADVISTRNGTKINDFIENLLDGTGVSLYKQTKDMNIELGTISLTDPRSLTELLEYWKKNFGLLSFIKMENGEPYLALSRTYFSENKSQTIISNKDGKVITTKLKNKDNTAISGDNSNVPIISFSEHVVKDNLTFTHLDYNTLAIEATSINSKNQKLKATIILNQAYIGSQAAVESGGLDKEIRETEANIEKAKDIGDLATEESYKSKLDKLNEQKELASSGEEFLVKNISVASKKKNKTGNIDVDSKFDMGNYNIRTYHEYNVSLETLIKNAKSVFKNISQTGIGGDLTVFGDFGFKSATMVRLFDKRNPEKNGTYVISDVKTSFGIGGYRQTIKIPFKRSN